VDQVKWRFYWGKLDSQRLLSVRLGQHSPLKSFPTKLLKAVVMDFRKRTRTLFQSGICFGTTKLGASGLAYTESATTMESTEGVALAVADVQVDASECWPVQLSASPSRRCQAPLFKLPAKVMLALLLVCCACVPFRTAHGESPRGFGEVEIQQLIEQLAQSDFDLREAAERQLIEIGSPAVDPLVGALLDCTPDVCSRVKRILQTVASECDEESLFKVLAALRIRFEVPVQRIKPLLDDWAIQSRSAVVAQWRKQGAVVLDPFEHNDPRNQLDQPNMVVNRMFDRVPQQEGFRFEVVLDGATVVTPRAKENSSQGSTPGSQVVPAQSIAERLRLVLNGSLEQNKEFVMSSKKGAEGFEKSLATLQRQPVSVTIGEDWRGDYSEFEITGAPSNLLINSARRANAQRMFGRGRRQTNFASQFKLVGDRRCGRSSGPVGVDLRQWLSAKSGAIRE